jgi:YesN/AraC family two-component response regulator
MTYKIIFIDDEVSILRALPYAIDWGKYNIQIAGTASDGEEGLQLYETVKPNIIIADIKMPDMNGLEFSRRIRERDPRVKIILLSAYGEFEYAQSAMQYKINNYLLKPLDEGKLEKGIQNVLEEIVHETDIDYHIGEYNDSIVEKRLRQIFIKYSQTGRISEGERNELDSLIAYFSGTDFFCKLVCIENLTINFEDAEIWSKVKSIFAGTLGKHFSLILLSRNELMLVASRNEFLQCLQDIKKEIENLSSEHGCRIIMGISDSFGKDLIKCIDQARNALYDAFYDEYKKNTYYYTDSFYEDSIQMNNADIQIGINALVEQGSSQMLTQSLTQQMEALYKNHVKPDMIYEYLMDQLTYIKIALTANYDYKAFNILRDIDIRTFIACGSYRKLFDFSIHLINQVRDKLLELMNERPAYTVINKAKEYISRNYTNKDLSLAEAAQYAGLSKNHFSRVFHNYTGQTFWSYLTKYRMNIAKELLKQTNLSNFDISQKIGYESEYHFCRKFKEETGTTPQRYRKI